MRRDKNDKKWQQVKEFVWKRDNGECQLTNKLTWREIMLLKNLDGVPKRLFTTLDPAHVFPVSNYPELIYNPDNVVVLCRYFHECLDNHIDPFTQRRLSNDELQEYWERIIGEDRYKKLIKLVYYNTELTP